MGHGDKALRIEVAYSAGARQMECVSLTLPVPSTVRDALQASGLPQRFALEANAWLCGVWGQRCALTQLLRDGDRVELYRSLAVEPKQARRLRYKGAGQRNSKKKGQAGAGR